MSSTCIETGIVIPVYQKKFIRKLIKNIEKTVEQKNIVFCIVNDGRENLRKYLDALKLPENFRLIHLEKTQNFAGANNRGWEYLIRQYPEIKYLGSLNDDTKTYIGWLEPLINLLEKDDRLGISMPQMIVKNNSYFSKRQNYALWELRKPSGMRPKKFFIEKDEYSSALNGFCFISKRKALEDVGFFDERFLNGCEDLDLGINMLIKKWKLIVSKNSYVFHYGGGSRNMKDTNTNTEYNHLLLSEKYPKVVIYNELDSDGFLSL